MFYVYMPQNRYLAFFVTRSGFSGEDRLATLVHSRLSEN